MMRFKFDFIKRILLFSLLIQVLPETLLAQDALYFIVNAQNETESVTLNELRDYYFKKRRAWPDGTSVRFIDAGQGTAALRTFQSQYLNRNQKDVDLYWIGQKLYSGDTAPLREASEQVIVQFVASLKGGLGYVTNPSLLTGKNVKVIRVEAAEK